MENNRYLLNHRFCDFNLTINLLPCTNIALYKKKSLYSSISYPFRTPEIITLYLCEKHKKNSITDHIGYNLIGYTIKTIP